MILTGKCKEDFGDKCVLDKHEFDKLPESCKNALIIDFFDSVGIYVNPEYNEVAKKFGYFISLNPISDDILSLSKFNSRTEATTEAIKKANQIYNERITEIPELDEKN